MLRTSLALFALLTSSTAFAHKDRDPVARELAKKNLELCQLGSCPIDHYYPLSDNYRLFRGAGPTSEEDMRYLARMGTKFIISVQGGDYSDNKIIGPFIPLWEKGETPKEIDQERAWAEKYGMDFINLPLNSLSKVDEFNAGNIQAALRLMHQFEISDMAGTLFIHCAHGCDRTGLVVALYRVIYQGWTVDAAYAEWRRLGHTLVNMTTTWHLDEYFFEYLQWWASTVGHAEISGLCEYNLIL